MPEVDATVLPEAFQAMPLFAAQGPSALTVCVLLPNQPPSPAETFFVLRIIPGARVYLGCVLDAGGRAHELVEIWVQTTQSLIGSPASLRENLTNGVLDERWSCQAKLARQTDPAGFIQTGFEGLGQEEPKHPPPTFFDGKRLVALADQAGRAWELCREDALLETAGLPRFTDSLYRYLYQPAAGKDTRFIPLAEQAPANQATLPLDKAIPAAAVPFNAEGGLLMVRAYYRLALEEFVERLSGRAWSDSTDNFVSSSGTPLPSGSAVNPSLNGACYLGWDSSSQSARLLEVLHLKLNLLADILDLVRSGVKSTQLPFLNLCPESFRVRLDGAGARLPLFWTAKAGLITMSQAHSVPIHGGESNYFVRLEDSSFTNYSPQGMGQSFRGNGNMLLTRARDTGEDKPMLEGTLRTVAMLPPISASSILRLAWVFRGESLELYGSFDKPLGSSVLPFRTFPKKLKPDLASALLSMKTWAPAPCAFEVIPGLSSRHDLYSIGLLAIRILLVHDASIQNYANFGDSLAMFLRLGGAAGSDSVSKKVKSLFEADASAAQPTWLPLLGPHRLITGDIEPKAALDLVPIELWSEVIAFVLELLQAGDPDATTSPALDCSSNALEPVFIQPISTLDGLLRRTRSLLLVDWNYNREINTLIQEFLKAP